MKSVVADGAKISVAPPGLYAQRFLDFIESEVFEEAPQAPPQERAAAVPGIGAGGGGAAGAAGLASSGSGRMQHRAQLAPIRIP